MLQFQTGENKIKWCKKQIYSWAHCCVSVYRHFAVTVWGRKSLVLRRLSLYITLTAIPASCFGRSRSNDCGANNWLNMAKQSNVRFDNCWQVLPPAWWSKYTKIDQKWRTRFGPKYGERKLLGAVTPNNENWLTSGSDDFFPKPDKYRTNWRFCSLFLLHCAGMLICSKYISTL